MRAGGARLTQQCRGVWRGWTLTFFTMMGQHLPFTSLAADFPSREKSNPSLGKAPSRQLPPSHKSGDRVGWLRKAMGGKTSLSKLSAGGCWAQNCSGHSLPHIPMATNPLDGLSFCVLKAYGIWISIFPLKRGFLICLSATQIVNSSVHSPVSFSIFQGIYC